MVTANIRNKVLLSIGLTCLSSPTFSMESEEQEKEQKQKHSEKSPTRDRCKSLSTPVDHVGTCIPISPRSKKLLSGSEPTTPISPRSNKSGSFMSRISSFNSNDEKKQEKFKYSDEKNTEKFAQQILKIFESMKKITSPGNELRSREDYLNYLRWVVFQSCQDHKFEAPNKIDLSELNSENLLNTLWNNNSISFFVQNVVELEKLQQTTLACLAVSASVLYEIHQPQFHHTNGHRNGTIKLENENYLLNATCILYAAFCKKCHNITIDQFKDDNDFQTARFYNIRNYLTAAKYLTANGEYEKAWHWFQAWVNSSNSIETKDWMKPLKEGYLNFVKNKQDANHLFKAESYRQIAQLERRLNKNLIDDNIINLYLESALNYELHAPKQARTQIERWDKKLLYHLACASFQRQKDNADEEPQLAAIASYCLEFLQIEFGTTGKVEDCFHIGDMYQNGIGVEINDEEAAEYYKKASDKRHVIAQLRLAELQVSLFDAPSEALRYYNLAADNGNIDAQIKLADTYATTENSFCNIEKAVEFYKNCIDEENHTLLGKSLKLLNDLFNKGTTYEKQHEQDTHYQAKDIYSDEMLEDLKDKEAAQLLLAQVKPEAIYSLDDVKLFLNNAIEYYTKEIIKYLNNPEPAKWLLGKAIEYYKKAAEQKDPEVLCKLADIYADLDMGYPNDQEAAKLYKEAADKGHVLACYNVAGMYRHSVGVSVDKDLAIQYYDRVVQYYAKEFEKKGLEGQEEKEDAAKSAFFIGELLEEQSKPEIALKWYRTAKRYGYQDAFQNIKKLVQSDKKLAFFYHVMVFKCYAKGVENLEDKNEAADAAFFLGQLCEENSKPGEASQFYQKAHRYAHPEAQENIDRLLKSGLGKVECESQEQTKSEKAASNNAFNMDHWMEDLLGQAAEEENGARGESSSLEDGVDIEGEKESSQKILFEKELLDHEGEGPNHSISIEEDVLEIKLDEKGILKGEEDQLQFQAVSLKEELLNNETEKQNINRLEKKILQLKQEIELSKQEIKLIPGLDLILNDPDLCFFYGLRFWLGQDVSQNFKSAVWFFEKGAKFGHPNAHFNLGKIYSVGFDDISKDIKKSTAHYLVAADLGHVEAQYEVGMRYAKGTGVPKNLVKAASWMVKAADQGNGKAQKWLKLADPDIQFSIGLYYEGQREFAKAIERYEEAEKQENRDASYKLALIYGSLGDVDKARHHYAIAAKKGHPDALYAKGLWLEKRGTEEAFKKAIHCYERAKNQGHSKAMYRLAVMTQNGSGVAKNPIEAQKLYEMAAQYGCDEARAYLSKLEENIRSKARFFGGF